MKAIFFILAFTLYFFLVLDYNKEKLHAQNNTQDNTPNQENQNPPKSNIAEATKALGGFENKNWGMNFSEFSSDIRSLSQSSDIKERTKIINMILHKLILVKRNKIIYRYNFYKTPYSLASLKTDDLNAKEYKAKEEGEFFHVQISIPLTDSVLVKKKLKEKYGESNLSNIDKKGFGADIWQFNDTIIYLRHEGYKGKSFTRRIDFMSLKHLYQINNEYKNYFTAQEQILLKKL